MFFGQYLYGIDNKGRVSIPGEFRKKLGEEIMITCGLEECLIIYTIEDWTNLANKASFLPFTKTLTRGFNRLFFSGCYNKEIDQKGRINIEKMQLEYANLVNEDEVVFVGAGNYIEVWNKSSWDKVNSSRVNELSKVSEDIDLV